MTPSILELIGLATCFIGAIAIVGGTIYSITKFINDFNQLKARLSHHTGNTYLHNTHPYDVTVLREEIEKTVVALRKRIENLEQALAERNKPSS